MHVSILKSARLLVLITAFALLAAACGPGEPADPGAEPTPTDATEAPDEPTEPPAEDVEGGTVVYGADQEPAILNSLLTEGNLFANSIIVVPVLEALWMITPDFEYVPMLLDGEPEITDDPFSVTYTLKEEATWSDGEPLTAEDVVFTWETCLNEEWDITSRDGCDDISGFEILDDKTVRFDFTEPYAPWRTLFSTASGVILPKHALEGEDFNTVWNDGIVNPKTDEPIASGPFQFDSWQKGQQLTIVRNENYWGELAGLDSIIFRFIEDSNTQVQQLRGGEIDMFYPQPQLDLVDQVAGIDGVTSEASAGTVWEHLDFNLAVPPLDQHYVRQAIAMGINRDEIVEAFITPLNPDAVPLGNAIYVNNQAEYEDHFNEVAAYDPEGAIALLEENGCTRGDDQIFTCAGERVEFDYVTTAGNELRELQLELIQSQLAEIGVQINAATGAPADVFGTVLPAGPEGAWDLFNFAWVGSPDPVGSNAIFECEGDQNYNSYCNEEVTSLIQQTNTAVDPDERARLYNEADALMAQDMPLLPLYQKPTFFAWSDRIEGPRDNPTQLGPTWNAGEWRLTS